MDQRTRGLLEFYSKKYLNVVGIVLAVVLMIPTTAILATWNTLPGEKLYPVKNYLEEVALRLVGDNFAARTELQTRFVSQRFDETQILLARSSSEGLDGLSQQIRIAKSEIVAASEGEEIEDVVVAQKKAEEFVEELREYERELEITKNQLEVSSNPTPTPIPTTTTTTVKTTTALKTFDPTPTPTAVVVGDDLPSEEPNVVSQSVDDRDIAIEVEQVREEIRAAIEELEVVVIEREVLDQTDSAWENEEDMDDEEKEEKIKSNNGVGLDRRR